MSVWGLWGRDGSRRSSRREGEEPDDGAMGLGDDQSVRGIPHEDLWCVHSCAFLHFTPLSTPVHPHSLKPSVQAQLRDRR